MRKPAASHKALPILAAAVLLAAWIPSTAAVRLPPRREMLFFLNPEWALCWRYVLRSRDCAVDTFTSFFALHPLHLSTGCCNALPGIDSHCILSWLNPLLPLYKTRCSSTQGGVGRDVGQAESPGSALNPSTSVGTSSPIPESIGGSVSSSASLRKPPKPEEAKSRKGAQGKEPATAPTVPPAVDQRIGPSASSFSTPLSVRGIEPVASPRVAPSSSRVQGIEPSPSPLTSSRAVAPTSPHGKEEPFSTRERGIEPSLSPAPTSSHGVEEPFSSSDRGVEPSPPPLELIRIGHRIESSPSPSSPPNSNGPSSQQGDLSRSSALAPSSSNRAQEPIPNGDQGIEPSPSPLEVGLAPSSSIVLGPISNEGFEPSPSPSGTT